MIKHASMCLKVLSSTRHTRRVLSQTVVLQRWRGKKYPIEPVLESVLPFASSPTTKIETAGFEKKLGELDRMIENMNQQLSEFQAEEYREDRELESVHGVRLPIEYRRKITSIDPDEPPSRYTCVGCGAPLHCCDPERPGFIPSSAFKTYRDEVLQNSKCIRCETLAEHGVALDYKVSEDEFNHLISNIKTEKCLILHVIDVTDLNNSLIPDLHHRIGEKQSIVVVGNKIDLLPPDSKTYLQNINEHVKQYSIRKYGERRVKGSFIVSALTGYGIEELITKLLMMVKKLKTSIYIVGCTNSGKSTLFNRLLMSDLCSSAARDQINRATTSIWPGTTMNLLKFPMSNPPRWKLAIRNMRVHENKKLESQLERGRIPAGNVDLTYTEDNVEIANPSNFSLHGGKIRATPNNQISGSYNYDESKNMFWLYDTPGLINPEQIINSLNMTELKILLMNTMSRPVKCQINVGSSLLIAGLARIDLTRIDGDNSDENVTLTVYAAAGLPLHTLSTENVENFYKEQLATDQLVIPSSEHSIDELKRVSLYVDGNGKETCSSDIQLSSIGWVSVAAEASSRVYFNVWTPSARGIKVRDSLLPYIHTASVTIKPKHKK